MHTYETIYIDFDFILHLLSFATKDVCNLTKDIAFPTQLANY